MPGVGAEWKLVLCDKNGKPLYELADLRRATISERLNEVASVTISVGLASGYAPQAGTPGSRLKVYRRGDSESAYSLVFYGLLMPEGIEHGLYPDKTVTSTFVNPLAVLKRRCATGVSAEDAPLGEDVGDAIWRLIDVQNSRTVGTIETDTWIRLDSATTGATLDEARPVRRMDSVWDAIDGLRSDYEVDMVFTPRDAWAESGSRIMGDLLVVAQAGSYKPIIRLGAGERGISTVSEVIRRYEPATNYARAETDSGTAYATTTPTDPYGIGLLEEVITCDHGDQTATRVQRLVNQHAAKHRTPVATYDLGELLGNAAQPYGTIQLGDRGKLWAREAGAEISETTVRVTGWDIELDAEGNTQTTLVVEEF